jgi:uncharacterized membrane protein
MTLSTERRKIPRLEKKYQVFCRSEGRSGIAESLNINEKGIQIATGMDIRLGEIVEMRIMPADEVFSFTCDGKVIWVNPRDDLNGAGQYQMGIEFLQGLKDFASEQLISGHERLSQRQSLIIHAAQKPCYDAITNFESYPKWQPTQKAVNVLERAPDGRPVVVEFIMEALLKKVRYVNRYEYFDRDYILSWKAIDGDIKVNEGSYVFKKLREDRTNAVFSLFLELGFYAPRRAIDYLANVTMRKSIMQLKNVVEKGFLK